MTKEQTPNDRKMSPIRIDPLRFSVAHALLGAFLGYMLIHPTALIIFLYGSGKSWLNILLSAFTLAHLPMGLYFAMLGLFVGGMNGALHALIASLEKQVETLESFLPICASCKKLRMQKEEDGEERWMTVEEYITSRHDQKLTHTICKECVRKLYPDFASDIESQDKKS